MHIAFSRNDHRRWPVPAGRWTWRQCWYDLLFAHWPVPVDELQRLVPPSLVVQEFAGTGWLGVVPFRMSGVRRRPLPAVPGLSAFPELNLRTYVERDGKPGVWFVSLDAANALAVWAAKRYFHLPYYLAAMEFKSRSDGFTFSSRRVGSTPVSFRADYRPMSPVFEATPNTLESFLVERYCLYAQAANGDLYRGDVHHVPWPLQRAEGDIEASELVTPHGLSLNGPPLLHFSRGVDVVVWPFTRLT